MECFAYYGLLHTGWLEDFIKSYISTSEFVAGINNAHKDSAKLLNNILYMHYRGGSMGLKIPQVEPQTGKQLGMSLFCFFPNLFFFPAILLFLAYFARSLSTLLSINKNYLQYLKLASMYDCSIRIFCT